MRKRGGASHHLSVIFSLISIVIITRLRMRPDLFGVSQNFVFFFRRSVRMGFCCFSVGTILVAHLYNKVVKKSHWTVPLRISYKLMLKSCRRNGRKGCSRRTVCTTVTQRTRSTLKQKSNESKFDKHLRQTSWTSLTKVK